MHTLPIGQRVKNIQSHAKGSLKLYPRLKDIQFDTEEQVYISPETLGSKIKGFFRRLVTKALVTVYKFIYTLRGKFSS